MKIYCISGLGADERVFDKLKINAELVHLKWILPAHENLRSYALRLAESIDDSEPFCLIGVSFGGMVATEIGKVLHPKRIFLISTAEVAVELPFTYRAFGKTNITSILPNGFFDMPRGMAAFMFGTDQKEMLTQILDDTDPAFTKWAVGALTNWDNESRLSNSVKIHGTHDRLIPLGNNPAHHLINDAGHFMIYDRADEVSEIINQELDLL